MKGIRITLGVFAGIGIAVVVGVQLYRIAHSVKVILDVDTGSVWGPTVE